ncbi:hypothetical protein ScPMuIL_008590 [Solemya velum]
MNKILIVVLVVITIWPSEGARSTLDQCRARFFKGLKRTNIPRERRVLLLTLVKCSMGYWGKTSFLELRKTFKEKLATIQKTMPDTKFF